MTPTDPRRDDDQALTLALFRYGVIAELVERDDFAPGERSALVRELASRTHYLPGKGPRVVRERTIYQWLSDYRSHGKEGLLPRYRRDRGLSRVLDEATLQRAVQLRLEQPKRWTSTLLDILRLEGRLDPIPHRSTLDRQLRKRNASRRQLRTLGTRRHTKMAFEHFGDLWVGDYHHGPVILGPNGQPTTAKLGAFIDHCTRWPVADRYYLAEDLASLRDTFLRALLTWGAPRGKVYVDRGAVYRSNQFAWSIQSLPGSPRLVHSKAYYSEGRGVIERWWQQAIAFEEEIAARPELLTLHELNTLWEAWRTLRYCEAPHSGLGRTPAEAIAEVTPRPIDPEVVGELFLVRVTRTVHKKDGCISIEGRRFLCDAHLRTEKVQVRYDPRDLSSVRIHAAGGGRQLQRAFPQPINAPPEPHLTEPERREQTVDYLALLRKDFDRKLVEHARPLAYAALEIDERFGVDDFIAVVVDLGGLNLRQPERRELVSFWDTYGPLPESLVRIAVEHGVRLRGRGRHPQIYLHAIRTLVQAHWRNPKEQP